MTRTRDARPVGPAGTMAFFNGGHKYNRHAAAVVHGHCHHKAIMTLADEETILRGMGLDYEILDSGCCGVAGAFGFARDHYEVSIRVGERVLLPAVRPAAPDTLIITDGFSCREQIAQTTDRRALHLAQVLQIALHDGPGGSPGASPVAASYRRAARRDSPQQA